MVKKILKFILNFFPPSGSRLRRAQMRVDSPHNKTFSKLSRQLRSTVNLFNHKELDLPFVN
jgi:hypothetical protein